MDLTVMHINKGNAHGTQGERSNPANSDPMWLLVVSWLISIMLNISEWFPWKAEPSLYKAQLTYIF